MNNLILIGFKGAGKTTLGRRLAEELKRRFIDTDDLFEQAPSILYQELGEQKFRELEKKQLRSLRELKGCVIATGGGVVLEEENRELLKSLGTVVHLETPFEVIRKRLYVLPAFAKSEAELKQIYYSRLGIYQAMAHHNIFTEDAVWEVIRLDPFSE